MAHRAVPGEHRAPQQRRIREWHPVRRGQHAARGDHRLLRERGDVQPGMQLRAVRRTGVHLPRTVQGIGAQPHLAQFAGVATPAGGSPVEYRTGARRDMRDALPHGDHRARPLVPEHRRQRHPHRPVGQGQIGVADPDGGEPDADLAGPGVGQIDLGELQRSAQSGQDGGTYGHGRSAPSKRDDQKRPEAVRTVRTVRAEKCPAPARNSPSELPRRTGRTSSAHTPPVRAGPVPGPPRTACSRRRAPAG